MHDLNLNIQGQLCGDSPAAQAIQRIVEGLLNGTKSSRPDGLDL